MSDRVVLRQLKALENLKGTKKRKERAEDTPESEQTRLEQYKEKIEAQRKRRLEKNKKVLNVADKVIVRNSKLKELEARVLPSPGTKRKKLNPQEDPQYGKLLSKFEQQYKLYNPSNNKDDSD